MDSKGISSENFLMGILRGFEMNIIKLGVKEEYYVALYIFWTILGEKATHMFRNVGYGCCTLYYTL